MDNSLRIAVALALVACIAGCVSPVPSTVVAVDRAKDGVVIGKSTKADVLAALGETQVISFDSGFEVWVYRLGDKTRRDNTAEFVILFAPSGIVAKTRIRPAPLT